MAIYSKMLLSWSTNGRAIAVTTSALPGNTIHTAINNGTQFDEIYLYAINAYGSNVNVTIWWGGTTAYDAMVVAVPPNTFGRLQIVDGRLVNNGLQVSATTTAAGVNGIFIEGFVNRIQ